VPAGLVKTARDERLWEKAKSRVAEEYGLSEADGDRYWRLVNGIYQAMRGRRKLRKALRSALRPLVEAVCKSWRGEPERHSEAAKKNPTALRKGLRRVRDNARHQANRRLIPPARPRRLMSHAVTPGWGVYSVPQSPAVYKRLRRSLRPLAEALAKGYVKPHVRRQAGRVVHVRGHYRRGQPHAVASPD
jgi:hypothetical protein